MGAFRFFLLNLLILMIATNCLIDTNCADSGRKRDKDTYVITSTSRVRKSGNFGRVASTSGAAVEAGSSGREKYNWTRELDNDILINYYGSLLNDPDKWNTIYEFLNVRHPNIPPSRVTHGRINTLLRKIIQTTPACGEGNTLWTTPMKSDVLKIYYQTRVADKKEHALDMYNEWRTEHPYYPDISPMDLLHQAENMLMRHNLLDLPFPLPADREQKIFADKEFKFNKKQEDLIREVRNKTPLSLPIRFDHLYDDLCREDSSFCLISPQKLSKKSWYLMKECKTRHQKLRARDEAEEENDFLNSRGQGEHHHFHEFMGVQDNPLVHSQRLHHHTQEIGSSSSHRESPHDHPNLDLSLGLGTVDIPQSHHPDVDLDLSLSSRKKKSKSIWKRGSS